MKTKQNDGWNRLRWIGRLTAIGLMMLIASLGARAESLGGWQKRMPIAFSGYTPPGEGETLTNFPALVIFSNTTAGAGFDYSDFQSPPYDDLRFAAADKVTPLDFEVELWDTNGLSYVWVRVPELTNNLTIHALWGKSAVEAPACTTNGAVWTAEYKGVYHMTAVNTVDSTSNRLDGVGAGAVAVTGAGHIGSALSWPGGIGDSVMLPASSQFLDGSSGTLMAWVKLVTGYPVDARAITLHKGSTKGSGFTLAVHGGEWVSYANNGTSGDYMYSGVAPDTGWHLLTTTCDGTTHRIYVDGVFCGDRAQSITAGSFNARIGHYDGALANYQWKGLLDEVRVASVARSSNWVWASFLNMTSNDVFGVYGAPELQDLPMVENSGGATNVTSSSAWLNGALVSTGTSATVVYAYWGLTDGGTNASTWANTNTWPAPQSPGALTVQVTGLLADSTYYYRLAASNTAGWVWTAETSVFITGEVWIEKTADASEIGPTPGTFTVHRVSSATNAALTVNYTVDGTAVPGSDYTALSGTVTIPQGEQTATIEVTPLFDHFMEGTETVVVTLAPGLHVIGSPSNATVEIADHGLVTLTWSGGGANDLASTAANWVEGDAPEPGDRIVLTNENAGALTWDLDIPLHSWLQDGYTGTVTVLTVYPAYGTFTNFAIQNDCEIQSGFLTHAQNSNEQKYRLCMTVGGNMTIGPTGSVHADERGYVGYYGLGAAEGAAYGGVSAGLSPGAHCYGSITDPADLGSGGRGSTHGGGALLLRVAGEMRNDGNCSTDGGTMAYGAGSGGSVWVFASSLTGSGHFSAKGGNGGIYRVGGGGRMAFILTGPGEVFSAFTGTMTAYSGLNHAFAGTVYRETVANGTGHGELIVDNLNGYEDGQKPYPGVFCYGRLATEFNYFEAVSYAFSRIVLTNKAVLFVGSDDMLDLRGTELVGGGPKTGIRVGGGTILTPPIFTLSNMFFCVTDSNTVFSGDSVWIVATNAELRIDKPLALTNDVIIKAGGKLTHTANTTTEAYRLDLTVNGSLTVQTGGSVDVTARGYAGTKGPGTGWGGSYGGQGYNGGACYGSITAPTNMGSGGNSQAGGGAILLRVSEDIVHDGLICANGKSGNYSGSGGSINLIAGTLTGSGSIWANAGVGGWSGGGGRIAFVVTNTGADFSAYSGLVQALGDTGSTRGGAGTIYREVGGSRPGYGTVLVDNNASGYTDVPPLFGPTGEVDRVSFVITNSARLRLTNDFTVGDIWLQSPNSWLDLGTNTLTVNTEKHDLTPGIVTNYGAIIWWIRPPGTIFKFW